MKFCTLISNGSLQSFPQNTLSLFTNAFSQPIYPRRGSDKLYVRLRGIAVSNRLQYRDPGASLLKIHLSELQPRIGTSINNRCLAKFHFPYTIKKKAKYFLKEFKNTPFLPITSIPLTSLTIKLTNRRDNQLPLDIGPPTLIYLEISDMDLSKNFTITCSSNDGQSGRIYPNNRMDDFTCRLPREINLKDWEVALSCITFPPGINKKTSKAVISFYICDISDKTVLHVFHKEYDEDALKGFETGKEMMEDIAKEVSLALHIKDYVRLGELDNGYYQIISKSELPNTFCVGFEWNEGFNRLLGRSGKHPRKYLLAANVAYTIKGVIDLTKVDPSNAGLLYCDLIQPSIVGGQLVQAMKLIPLPSGGNTASNVYEPKHLLYHPVQHRTFSAIKFQIMQADGQNIWFQERRNSEGINITLIFKPSNNYAQSFLTNPNNNRGGGNKREAKDHEEECLIYAARGVGIKRQRKDDGEKCSCSRHDTRGGGIRRQRKNEGEECSRLLLSC